MLLILEVSFVFFISQDMSHVAGKSKKELQAMASSFTVAQHLKEDYPFSPPKVKYVSPSLLRRFSIVIPFLISFPNLLQS